MRKFNTIMITGASSGIGKEFANQLAEQKHNLILVARRKERLELLSTELQLKHNIKVEVVACDLNNQSDRRKLSEYFKRNDVDFLINNAGYGKIGSFISQNTEDVIGQVEVNCVALVELSHYALKSFVKKNFGGMINVASIAGFLPLPNFAIYAASKSFVRDFTESLAFELKDTNIQVSALCPGPIKTEFGKIAGHVSDNPIQGISVEECVRITLKEYQKGKTIIIPDITSKIITSICGVIPRKILLPFGKKAVSH